MKPKIELQTHRIITAFGKLYSGKLLFLNKQQLKEFDNIGSGSTRNMSREYFLNSLDKGTFKVIQTVYDNGNHMEAFNIIRAYINE